MPYRIKLKEGKKVKSVKVAKVIRQYDNLIYKICIKWINSFAFDRSIDIDDLVQELRIKFLCDLNNYDYKEGNIIPYMSKIAINFFINKRKQIISRDCYPVGPDGKVSYLLSTSAPLNDEEDITIEDTLHAKENQHDEYYSEELVKSIRKKLDTKKYKPKGFRKNGKSFTLEVFDLLYFQNEEFLKTVTFHHRCRVRKAMYKKNGKVPKIIIPTTKMVGDFIGVDKRTINSAYTIIKETIKKEGVRR
jgi:DNA-directed RNA polymerase specialized sigma24 family protein